MPKTLLTIGSIICLCSVFLIAINYVPPHTNTVERTVSTPFQVSVPHEQQIASSKDETLQSNYYRYYHDIQLSAGDTFQVKWSSDNSINAYIMSENQFTDYNSSASNLFYTMKYLSTGSGSSGTITYSIQGTGSYVAMLKNQGGVLGGGSSAFVYEFTLSKVTYSQETRYNTERQTVIESDNLYLQVGGVALIVGIVTIVAGLMTGKRNNTSTLPVKQEYSNQESFKHCIYCGTKLPSNAKYCNNCGQTVS
jgi:hypothetical protein